MNTDELRAMDAEIATKVMGDVYHPDRNLWVSLDGSDIACADGGPKRYSSDMTAAWLVVEKLGAACVRLELEDWRDAPGGWAALFDHPDGGDTGHHRGDTAPEAICRAALKAVAR